MACTCCAGEALDIFSAKGARRELRRYLRKGLRGVDAERIAAWAEQSGLERATVLEVGGGVGQLQAELLRRGAERGTVVEVLDAYAPFADELARALGLEARTSFRLADLTEDADAVDPADVVVLRRVVCCSPAGPELLAAAAGRTRRVLLASYPRDRLPIRLAARLQNAALGLIGKRFRVFVHAPAELERAVRERGLRRTRLQRGPIWETAAFERAV